MPIATAALGFVVMFFFGAATGHIATTPEQKGKTVVTENGSRIRFYDIVDRQLTGVNYDLKETVNECVCKEKAPKVAEARP